tara:strand:+ start:196 stop:402 length:207 start_codon:yes stop_codon:yes gene_type:complete
VSKIFCNEAQLPKRSFSVAFPAPTAAQAVLRLDDIPNCFPTSNKANITSAISGVGFLLIVWAFQVSKR